MLIGSSDPRDARELVEALEMLERRRRTDGSGLRPFVAGLLAVARSDSVRSRHEPSPFDGSERSLDGDAMPLPRLMDLTEVADRLDVSKSTVERLVANGELPVVHPTAGSTRVHSDDLVAFMDGLRSGVVSKRKVSA